MKIPHQKTNISLAATLLVGSLSLTSVYAADFTNGGFESGNTTGWTVTGGTWNGTPIAPLDPGSYTSSGGTTTIVTSATSDSYLSAYNTINNTSITPVFDGAKALRINDASNNRGVTVVSQTVNNYTGSTIYIAWLAVLQGSHGVTDSDHFVIKVKNLTTSTDVATVSYSSANTGSFFTNVGSSVYVSGWQAQAITVTSGNSYELSLLAADCPYGGHWGYVYLDFAGSVAPAGLTVTTGQPGSSTSKPDIVTAGNVGSGSGINIISTLLNGTSASYNNTFDGGTLKIDTLNQSYAANFSITSNGGVIDQNGNAVTFTGVFSNDTVADTGSLTVSNTGSGGSVTITGVNTYTGNTTVNSGATLIIGGAGQLGGGTYSANIINNGTFVYSSTANQIIDGVISGSGDLTKQSTGTLTLNGINTFTGNTSVTAGTLLLGDASHSTAVLPGTISVASGGTLAGYGTAGGSSTTLTNSGTVSPGNNSIATLTVGGGYTQTSTGNLSLGLTPTTNDLLAVTGNATLNGTVTISGSSGTYSPTRYTLLTSSGRSGTFSTLDSNLSSYTTLGYFLSYDANNVYLTLGPDYVATTSSLRANHDHLRSVFASEGMGLLSGLNYDCSLFGQDNICLSTGGRVSYTFNPADKFDGHRPTNISALLIGAYRPEPTLRIGGWLDQDLYTQNSNVRMSNSNPMIGLFGVYYPSGTNAGLQVKGALSYVDKKVEITREQLSNTEPGKGSTRYKGFGAQFELAYGLSDLLTDTIVSPFIGLRNYDANIGAYSENSNLAVQVPITYSKYSQRASMLFAGIKLDGNFSVDTKYTISGGVETDFSSNNSVYAGSSNIYGLSTFSLDSSSKQRDSRGFASAGITHFLEKNETIYFGVSYRQDRFKGTSMASGILLYTIGL